jgi:phosphoribosylanthranilate isomerase
MTRFKICCIQNADEARTAVESGASALGFVSEMPSGPGPIPEDRIAAIVRLVPPGVSTFLLTSKKDAQAIIQQQKHTGANTLQIVDSVPTETYRELRSALPGIALIQVIHVRGPQSVDEAISVAPEVDGLLLDSGNPDLPVKILGGTGNVHDWNISRQIVERSSKPVFLAGGLKAENLRSAIEAVGPFGVDVCSGVRTNGVLDRRKLMNFTAALASV